MLVLTCSENDIINQDLYDRIVRDYLLVPETVRILDEHLDYTKLFKLLRVISFLKVFYLK